MPALNPRALGDAVERRWPGLIRWQDPAVAIRANLKLAMIFQVVAGTVVLIGPPYSYGAAPLIGGTIGLLWGVLREHRRAKRNRG